jgi:SAM-dependent methyltransferase
MAQYQSFPDAAGDSKTQAKLKALKLPELAGRSFLDVGCNEGYFCGFASFMGARRSVGLDQSKLFIARARQRFPGCEFHQQGWERLPDGEFDVILLASALHYAQDQPALLHRLAGKLSKDGVLVLEIGIVSAPESAFVRVKRGIDEREFPTMAKLREILHDYAWKWMGRSVSQDGDPVARHVIHVSRRRPVAYLLMQPPAFGKSSIASRLFAPAGIPVVSGDQEIALIAQGRREAPEQLRSVITHDYSPFRIDETTHRIFDSGAGEALIRAWMEQVGDGDFALDAYVPVSHHPLVESVATGLGYLPVQLRWDRAGPRLLPADAIDERAEAFYMSMAAPGMPRPSATDDKPAPGEALGFVDELSFSRDGLAIRGWAIDAKGELPGCLGVRIDGREVLVRDFIMQPRTDVQRHLHLSHANVGYRIVLELPRITGAGDVGADFGVFVPGVGDLRLAGRVAKLFGMKGRHEDLG